MGGVFQEFRRDNMEITYPNNRPEGNTNISRLNQDAVSKMAVKLDALSSTNEQSIKVAFGKPVR